MGCVPRPGQPEEDLQRAPKDRSQKGGKGRKKGTWNGKRSGAILISVVFCKLLCKLL